MTNLEIYLFVAPLLLAALAWLAYWWIAKSDQSWDRIEGNWKQFKGRIQQKWGKLTDDDLDIIEGKRTELAGRLQARYGYDKDQAERDIDDWLKSRPHRAK